MAPSKNIYAHIVSDLSAQSETVFSQLHNAVEIAEANDCSSINDVVFTEDYVILSSENEVLVNSKINIPFEPNAEQLKLRELVRAKLKALQPREDSVFCARYGCVSSPKPDIENALFYNIGTASFTALATETTSVYFQRIPANEIYGAEDREFLCCYHYSFQPKENRKHWWERDCICEWDNIPLKKVNSSSKAIDYYSAIKQSPNSVSCFKSEADAPLGMKIHLFVPKGARFTNILSVIKPMIDGTICALHKPDGIKTDEVSELLNISREILSSSENTCLGKRCFVYPYGKYVKWDPEDDRLDYVVAEASPSDDDGFSFSGQIFTVGTQC